MHFLDANTATLAVSPVRHDKACVAQLRHAKEHIASARSLRDLTPVLKRLLVIENTDAKGTRFGRKSALDAGQRKRIAERYGAGETMAELARDYNCGEATIWRALRG